VLRSAAVVTYCTDIIGLWHGCCCCVCCCL